MAGQLFFGRPKVLSLSAHVARYVPLALSLSIYLSKRERERVSSNEWWTTTRNCCGHVAPPRCDRSRLRLRLRGIRCRCLTLSPGTVHASAFLAPWQKEGAPSDRRAANTGAARPRASAAWRNALHGGGKCARVSGSGKNRDGVSVRGPIRRLRVGRVSFPIQETAPPGPLWGRHCLQQTPSTLTTWHFTRQKIFPRLRQKLSTQKRLIDE